MPLRLASPRVLALLWRAAVWSGLRAHPLRTLVNVLGILFGVALGFAVTLVNSVAVAEFSSAVQRLSGNADLVVRGGQGGLPEDSYPLVASDPDVTAASPALDVRASVAGQREALPVLGVDPFQAQRLGQPGAQAGEIADRFALLEPDAVVLSRDAARWLGVSPGGRFGVQVGLERRELRVVGLLPSEVPGRLGVMDVAGAQWLFERLGRLDRIDLRLKPGASEQRLRQRLLARLPAGARIETPRQAGQRSADISRAYRVNLGVLSLVALFTGGFLVFAGMVNSVAQRRRQLAVLRVLGLPQRALLVALLAEGLAVGAAGALPGLAVGWFVAQGALQALGGDLGAGYFDVYRPVLQVDPWWFAVYFALGVGAALAGALVPAVAAARNPPAATLKGADREGAVSRAGGAGAGAVLILAGVGLAQAPPVHDLPLFGYIGIALVLIGTVALMPWLLGRLAGLLPLPAAAPARTALLQLRGAPGQASLAVAAIVVSFSLMVAMAIMVTSFRASVQDWLGHMLRADLYLRAAPVTGSAYFGPAEQAILAGTPGVTRIEFLRAQRLSIAAGQPEVVLLARPVAPDPEAALPLVGATYAVAVGGNAVWISEAVRDGYGLRPGDPLVLPLAGRNFTFTVAGVWRDYARQTGSVVMDLEQYRRLTGDRTVNDAALWVAPGFSSDRVLETVRARLPAGAAIEARAPAEIRRMSLRTFDRTFAVTYVLEGVAVLIGLLGVSSSFGARILARAAQFGVLRHLGFTRAQVRALIVSEAALLAGAGVATGWLVGWGLSVILIRVVNPQSFHWSMDLHVPVLALGVLGILVMAGAMGSALAGSRSALGREVLRAVREE